MNKSQAGSGSQTSLPVAGQNSGQFDERHQSSSRQQTPAAQMLLLQAKGAPMSQQQQQQPIAATAQTISRQHLTARVKTIIGKILESHGAELRRTLFSLRQLFQDDSELAAEFVELDGLECLMKVTLVGAPDQIHQNYILRALGQLIDYPAGMSGLSKHNATIQWLYSLLASRHRLVVKTAIKLLLQFVEHSDNNCLHFCRSIKSVDESKGARPWTNVIQIFNNNSQDNVGQQQQQDVSLLIDAMTLINKTLAGIPDQDTFYDFVDPLEEMDMEGIIRRTGSLNEQLREQYDVYEQVLRGEDADEEEEEEEEDNMEEPAEAADASEAPMSYGGQQGKPKATGANCQQQATRRHSKRYMSYVSKGQKNEIEQSGSRVADVETETSAPLKSPARSSLINGRPEQPADNNKPAQAVNNLARGKQQRASISSCSSSDSYASYGSGYASGSGNSTDHELKQRNNRPVPQASNSTPPGSSSKPASTYNGTGSPTGLGISKTPTGSCGQEAGSLLSRSFDPADGEEAAKEEEDDEHASDERRESQLKRHLSELEQLTDELASRNILAPEELGDARPIGNSLITARFRPPLGSSSSGGVADSGSLSASKSATSPEQPGPNNDSRSASATPTPPSQLENYNSNTQNVKSPSPTSNANKQAPLTSLEQQKQHMQQSNPSSQSLGPVASAKMVSKQQQPVCGSASAEVAPKQQAAKLLQHHNNQELLGNKAEPYYHNLFQWEQLVSKGVTRPLLINDLDFTDLHDEDDADLLSQAANQKRAGEPLTISIPKQPLDGSSLNQNSSLDSGTGSGSPKSLTAPVKGAEGELVSAPPPMPPPPISPWFNTISGGGSRPQSQYMSSPSPSGMGGAEMAGRQSPSAQSTYSNSTYASSRNSVCLPQTACMSRDSMQLMYSNGAQLASLRSASSMSSLLFGNNSSKYNSNKRKKTMKLFWKEVREDRSLLSKLTKKRTIWDEIKPVMVDTAKLEHLFESKAKDLLLSKSRNGLDGLAQRKVKITVLDAKRSNAINIGMTKLPPMRTIKSAILKMDSSIMNREGIEKILTTMMPTEEEKSRIIEAQLANPDTPLGTAEQFLLNLASISALEARLKLWAFQLDYAQIEKEVAEPLMDLKQAIEEIERSDTFRVILGTLLAIGNFLNSTNVKGFQIDYLEKVPEVKDTVHKHSLLHHLCLFIQEKFEDNPAVSESDLYSEFTAVNRASKVDYAEVAKNLKKMQQDCKASWDYLKIVAKHDGLANLMNNATCGLSSSNEHTSKELAGNKPAGKLNNLSKLSMITTIIGTENNSGGGGSSKSSTGLKNSTGSSPTESQQQQQQLPVGAPTTAKQLKTKVSDFLTDCAERIMVLMVIHRRVMNRFQKLLVYLGCPSHQIKQTQPQQILKIINEFALEYRTKRERVKEMLLKRAQQQHRNDACPLHQQHGRWQLGNRAPRWAGSQQLIGVGADSASLYNRPCSTASSCASSSTLTSNFVSSLNCPECLSSTTSITNPARCHANQSQQQQQQQQQQQNLANGSHPPGSPSGYSQISNYSDYLYDQSCCNSRQQSITPVPFGNSNAGGGTGRPHSISVSMYDLQQQQQQQQHQQNNQQNNLNEQQADEQLRRILGAGRSFDGACNDLYQLSHWSSTMARVPQRAPPLAAGKFRAASMDSPHGPETEAEQQKRQSSYYRYLAGGPGEFDDEPNSDDEILQSLVRTVTAVKGTGSQQQQQQQQQQQSSNKIARSKILSRISCDRKSLRRNPQGIEMAN